MGGSEEEKGERIKERINRVRRVDVGKRRKKKRKNLKKVVMAMIMAMEMAMATLIGTFWQCLVKMYIPVLKNPV